MSPPLLVFDLDGTLLDSSKGIQSALRLAISRVAPGLPILNFTNHIGPPIKEILSRAYGASVARVSDAIIAEYRRIYDSTTCTEASIYPGVLETLGRLKQDGAQLSIFTNKPTLPTQTILAALDLNRFFDVVISIDTHRPAFPSKAEMLKCILDRTGASSALTIVVGDSPDDADAALRWNCKFVKVTYGFGNWDAHAPSNHFQTLQAFPRLLDIIALPARK